MLYAAPLAPGAEAAERFADAMTAYAAIGIAEVHVMPMDGDPVGFVHNLGEHVIPRLPASDLRTASARPPGPPRCCRRGRRRR